MISKRYQISWRFQMNIKEIREKEIQGWSGYVALFVLIAVLLLSTAFIIYASVVFEDDGNVPLYVFEMVLFILVFTAGCIGFAGLKTVKPNEAYVFSLFGKYYGTLKTEGFRYVNPFVSANAGTKIDNSGMDELISGLKKGKASVTLVRKSVSMRMQTFVNGVQKVNDKLGNPVMVGAVVVWRITDPTKAVFVVDDYKEFLSNQADSIIRNVARLYPYDNMSEDDSDISADELTLRGSSQEIADRMKGELQERVASAGLEIIDVRINQLSYAEEIAAAMLQRQQAVAIIAARKKIVEGAVSMVEMALDQLKKDNVVEFDEDKKAQMVSNLLVVLCGNKDAQPVVNSGSIY